QVVADERDGVEPDPELRAQLVHGVPLAARAEHHGIDAQLVAACLRDRIALAGHHRHAEPGPPREIEGDPVARVKGLQLVAALGEHHPAIGEDAVHVHHEQAHAPRARRHVAGARHTEYRSSGAGRGAATAAVPDGSVGSNITTPAKNQNGSMMRMMMNELEPTAWTSRPTVPATDPRAMPRSAPASSRRAEAIRTSTTAHSRARNAAIPTTPVSTSVRAYCASMNRNPVTP